MRQDDFIGQKYYWFTGEVKDIDDSKGYNRVRVFCHGYYPDGIKTSDLPWATVMMPVTSAGIQNVGANHHLEEGSWVVGFFRDGSSAQDPIVMGSITTSTGGTKDLHSSASTTNKISTSGFKNKNILVTGGAGSIGFEICNQLLGANPKKIIVLDHSESNIYRLNEKLKNSKINLILGDIKDEQLIKKILDKYKIEFIFHAAAYKHVKFLEENILSAVENNIFGTLNILKAIKNKKINLTFISTDKAVKPRNILGMTKRVGEILSQYFSREKEYLNCRISIVRFGNVIGSDGSALPLFVNQIRQDIPISITDMKMKRYFMSIQEASKLVIQTAQIESNGKIFVLDMGKQMKIVNVIKKLFEIYKSPDQKLKFKVIGNKFNEKISEKLFYKNKNLEKKFPKILLANDPLPSKIFFFKFIEKINHYFLKREEKKLSLCLRNFFK